jgi:hypothetical protein
LSIWRSLHPCGDLAASSSVDATNGRAAPYSRHLSRLLDYQ